MSVLLSPGLRLWAFAFPPPAGSRAHAVKRGQPRCSDQDARPFCPRNPSSFQIDQRVSGQSGRGAYKTVRRCAVDKPGRLIPWGIDPGFMYLEGGNTLFDAGRLVGLPQTRNRQSAALIRRRLCGGDLERSKVHSDDQSLTQSFGGIKPLPIGSQPPPKGGGWERVNRRPSVPTRVPPHPLWVTGTARREGRCGVAGWGAA